MKTFRSIYCQRHGCDERWFAREVFYAALYPHAIPCVWVLGGFGGRYFRADRELIDAAATITDLDRLEAEISSYLMDADNQRWLRRVGRLRLSTRRLSRCVRCCFPQSGHPFATRSVHLPLRH